MNNNIKEMFDNMIKQNKEYKDYKIGYIIHYKETDDYEAIAFNYEYIVSIFLKTKKFEPIINGLYDFDNEIFGSLEKMQGEISYMSLDNHYNIWYYINDNINDINNNYGLELYLKYCKKNNITKNKIENETGLKVPDVMEYYKNREVKVLGIWETDYGDIACNALLLENNNKIANVIETYDVNKQEIVGKIYKDFDNLIKLPKISKCSKLLQFIYDRICGSDASMCHITEEDWNDYYVDNFNDKDIEKLKEEIKKYNLDTVITFNDEGYKIIGWGDLQTRFNDDRRFSRSRDYER